MTKPRIGFIGVGLMGHGMAKNIVAKGYPLSVAAHRNRAPVDDLLARGAAEAATPREVAERADIVHLCVSGSPQVEAVIGGADGIASADRPGLIVIDCSTSNPVSTLALGRTLAQRGMTLVDAPLNRTPLEAEAGTLATMVGADAETFATIEPVLRCWASDVMHLGALGCGHTMKLVNNFVAMGYAALYAEALAIARKAGLSVEQFHEVLGASRMRCGFYDTFMKWTLDGDPKAHLFTITNAHKDMRYVASLANETGALAPIQSMVKNAFAAMDAAGFGGKYVPMLADFIAQQNGLPPAAEARGS